MDIRYATRSRFLSRCVDMIERDLDQLKRGKPVRIEFEAGGYDGKVIVGIDAANHVEFGINWDMNDPTTFPARIKAAATALHICAQPGSYEIEHKDRLLTIKKL